MNTTTTTEKTTTRGNPTNCMVTTSHVKKFVKDTKGMNTSGEVIKALHAQLETMLTKAMEKTAYEGRKTVMARDLGVELGTTK